MVATSRRLALAVALLGCHVVAGTVFCAADAIALLQLQALVDLDVLGHSPAKAAMPLVRTTGRIENYRQELVNFGDAQYVAYLTIGHQMLTGIYDTGSSDLVVFGSECTTCGVAAHYNTQLSRTFMPGTLNTEQHFGSGSAASTVGRDHVALGPYDVSNQTLWKVTSADMPLLFNAAFEAIIGIGPPEASMANAWADADAMFSNLTKYYEEGFQAPKEVAEEATKKLATAQEMSQQLPPLYSLNVTRFSICLGSQPKSDGVFIWNDAATDRKRDLFQFIPVMGKHTWSVNLTSPSLVQPGAPNMSIGCESGCSALLDSGSSLLAMPGSIRRRLLNAMTVLDANCTNVHELPDLEFELGGIRVSLPPDSYVASIVGRHPMFLQQMMPNAGRQGLACYLAVAETRAETEAGPLWILGMPFFRTFYTTFNVGATRADRWIAVAHHSKEDCQPVAEPVSLMARELRHMPADKIRLPRTSHMEASDDVIPL